MIKYLVWSRCPLQNGVILSAIEILNERENRLLARKEYSVNFIGGSGFITRQAAIEAMAAKLGVDKNLVKIISLRSKFGIRNLTGIVFVYNGAKEVSRQLPIYMFIRELSKDERKKAREAAKAQPVQQAAQAPKK